MNERDDMAEEEKERARDEDRAAAHPECAACGERGCIEHKCPSSGCCGLEQLIESDEDPGAMVHVECA